MMMIQMNAARHFIGRIDFTSLLVFKKLTYWVNDVANIGAIIICPAMFGVFDFNTLGTEINIPIAATVNMLMRIAIIFFII